MDAVASLWRRQFSLSPTQIRWCFLAVLFHFISVPFVAQIHFLIGTNPFQYCSLLSYSFKKLWYSFTVPPHGHCFTVHPCIQALTNSIHSKTLWVFYVSVIIVRQVAVFSGRTICRLCFVKVVMKLHL